MERFHTSVQHDMDNEAHYMFVCCLKVPRLQAFTGSSFLTTRRLPGALGWGLGLAVGWVWGCLHTLW